ncbi:MAG: hypothetical protein IT381_16020 [Deltaproteobacteria bacterium]|nr:hypothetical protein [Deltaproteobacteria bacterium]
MARSNTKLWFALAALAASFGTLFAIFSTVDFVAHLDRQLHELHCSYIPGVVSGAATAEAGCRAVMNSAYSSFFRDSLWGGIPLSLFALAVFAYFTVLIFDMGLRGRLTQKSETAYLLLASGLPLTMSAIYFCISLFEIHALCKLCAGIYVSSSVLAFSAFMLHREASAGFDHEAKKRRTVYFLEGVGFVVLALVTYLAVVPDYDKKVLACGELRRGEDRQHALLSVSEGKQGTMLEVLDPLCPACKVFLTRFEDEHLAEGNSESVLLFPLDTECNWMLKQSLHPGACMLSRALICSGQDYKPMLRFILDNQEDFRITATKEPEEVRRSLVAKFPKVAGCIDQQETKTRLNNMLRYAMQNSMPIVTPQLYIENRRLCDEDSDLGLNYAVSVLERAKKGKP